MFVVGLFVVLLIAGRLTDELSTEGVIGFVMVFLACFVVVRLAHLPPVFILVPTGILNLILLLKIVGYDPVRWTGKPRI